MLAGLVCTLQVSKLKLINIYTKLNAFDMFVVLFGLYAPGI
jgi:hypothetical protein